MERAMRCLLAVLLLLLSVVIGRECVDDYAVVIDAGSTGSRCFVFHVSVDSSSHRNVSSHPCGKVSPGLSSFASNPADSARYVLPLLLKASHRIPKNAHVRATVHIKGTAGMRLLPEETQESIWNQLVVGLGDHPQMPFSITRETVGTIDGHSEAFFAVLASNFIAGSIDANLHPVEGKPLLGALDMGGSSTQLIFYNAANDGRKVHADDFWSHSWLNYGVHRVWDRVLEHLIAQGVCDSALDDFAEAVSLRFPRDTTVRAIANPCGFIGHEIVREGSDRDVTILLGTGDADACIRNIEQVIWPLSDRDGVKEGTPQPIDEIEHPHVQGSHFYGMSVYFFALDCLREMGPTDLDHWPAPSLAEVERAGHAFCAMSWEELESNFQGVDQHAWTTLQQLPDRCFEVLYITTILKRGFGFGRLDRSITFALEVGGKEVEWTLGFALAEVDFSPELVAQSELDISLSHTTAHIDHQ